ncbi:hypothetical protein TNCV_871101 [Trichonephila clavipes]|nr:hypothetical protein TNCV_871101 [Trichonephila clavipes]
MAYVDKPVSWHSSTSRFLLACRGCTSQHCREINMPVTSAVSDSGSEVQHGVLYDYSEPIISVFYRKSRDLDRRE